MFKRFFAILIAILALAGTAGAQIMTPVTWKSEMTMTGDDKGKIVLTAAIQYGWHMYSHDIADGGPQPFELTFPKLDGVKLDGKFTPSKAPHRQMDEMFGMELAWWTEGVTITQNFTATKPEFAIEAMVRYGACNDENCVPPSRETFSFNGTAKVKAAAAPVEEKAEPAETKEEPAAEETVAATDSVATDSVASTAAATDDSAAPSDLWTPVTYEDASEATSISEGSLWYIFFTCFLGGLVALFTPCVWPMIPMTVSFFLKQNKTKRKALGAAVTYGISIIVIYVLLGLLVTIIFGASALNELATSAGFNIAFFILLVVFAISFMGGFELTLPSSWSNKIDSKVDSTTGYLSIFFMAFTLALVSFSCTGPIIGTLLVEAAATSNFVSPAIGMFGFALALALPFSLFAMFPTMLKSMPKSGGWMNTVKVVLGFLELALALKFLSVADLAYGWRILDREVFVSLWIVIFALLGVYLLGKITFPHDSKVERIGVTRFMLACVSLSFAVYMLPGLWGAPLKSISAFAPPVSTQDFNLYEGSVHAQVDDFEEGMRLSEKLNKPVLLDFSGYGCVNCRKKEAAVWTDPTVKSKIDNDYILVTLMVDDKTPLPSPVVINEKDGKERTLRTYGDKWSYLQRTKFGANAQPYHVIVDKDAKPLAPAFVYKEDVPGYINFLDGGKKRFYEEEK